MNIIDEIKQARADILTQEQKDGLLKFIKSELTHKEFCQIDGAAHYKEQKWSRERWCDEDMYSGAPYSSHAAIADWLHSLGFNTCRYRNSFGVDNGLKVWI